MVTIRFAQVVASTGFVSVEYNVSLHSKGSLTAFAGGFLSFARVFEGFGVYFQHFAGNLTILA